MSDRVKLHHPLHLAMRQVLLEARQCFRIWIRAWPHRRLVKGHPIRLHLGCGADLRAGWINVDIDPPLIEGFDIIHADLRRRLPFRDGDAIEIYSSHVLEHLELPQAFAFLRECHRVLAQGGSIRLCLPDLKAIAKAWLCDDMDYLNPLAPQCTLIGWNAESATSTDHVDYAFHQNGEHRIVTDANRCMAMLKHVGFDDVCVVQYDRSIDPDEPLRERYSFVIVGRR